MGRRAKQKQTAFEFRTWGGKRDGAGRKRTKLGRPCVAHRSRGAHRSAHPVHVTLRARAGLPPFRENALFDAMRDAITKANHSPAAGDGFRIVEFSVQRDHVHLIAEAHDAVALSSGVRGLVIRLARAINRTLKVSGQVWGDRYHSRDLKTPRAVRNAIVYVLMNAKKHGARIASGVDRCSSAPWFAGFAARIVVDASVRPVATARTWLGAVGWRRRGLVHFDERPRAPS